MNCYLSDIKYITAVNADVSIIACLAMITHQSYVDVATSLNCAENLNDSWLPYLAANGYAAQDIWHDYLPEQRLIDSWPIRPFAPIHILTISGVPRSYSIMLDDGTVLDPLDINIRSRYQYHRVYRITGLWPVSGPVTSIIKNTTDKILKVKQSTDI
jgi:hypothetical protein